MTRAEKRTSGRRLLYCAFLMAMGGVATIGIAMWAKLSCPHNIFYPAVTGLVYLWLTLYGYCLGTGWERLRSAREDYPKETETACVEDVPGDERARSPCRFCYHADCIHSTFVGGLKHNYPRCRAGGGGGFRL